MNKKNMKRLFFSLLLLFAYQVNAGTYYIDLVDGNDSSAGDSEPNAWLTEAYAITQISDGNTLKYVTVDYSDTNLADWESLHDANVITETNETTQWANTVTLDDYERFGCYANGDFWIYHATSITITEFSPNSTNVAGRIKNGTMINPLAQSGQGYDNSMVYGTYVVAFNKGLDIVGGGDDLVVATESSVCSTVSVATAGQRPQLTDASILTVVDTVPDVGDFRPPFCSTDKTSNYNVDSFVTQDVYASILGKIDAHGDGIGTIPATVDVERMVQRPWLSHMEGEPAWYQAPTNNMPGYHSDYANEVGIIALWLNLLSDSAGGTLDDSDKRTTLIGFLQIGIDEFGVLERAGESVWDYKGGSGRKWPIVFAGVVFDDSDMMNVDASYDFYMDVKTFYVGESADYILDFPYTKTATGSGDRWGNYRQSGSYNEYLEYAAIHIGMPDWGEESPVPNLYCGATWNREYRYVINPYYGILLSALICNYAETPPADWGRTLWAHEELFKYIDRYTLIGAHSSSHRNAWCFAMWNEYRANYGTPYSTVFDITAAATPTLLATVPSSKTRNSITVSWSGAAAGHDITVDQTTVHLDKTSPYEITGLYPDTSYEIEVWGKKANGIRSLVPDELTETTEASTSSLVVYYKMDDAAGQTTVTDSSGNNYHGTAANNIVSTTGKKNEAIVFNGTDDYVEFGENSHFNFGTTGDLTVTAWVKVDGEQPHEVEGHRYAAIVGKGGLANTNPGFLLYLYDEKPRFQIRDNSENVAFESLEISFNDGEWHFIAGVVNRTLQTVKLYADGTASGTASSASVGSLDNTDQKARIGHKLGGGPSEDFHVDGDIDEVRIYNTALSAAQIRRIYSGGSRLNRPLEDIFRRSRY